MLTTVNAALTPTSACSYVQHNSENFENAWGIWTDGGADCARINNATYANSVPYSIQLRDNTSTSVMTTTSQNCASYSEMKVSFSYIALSFDNSNEDFWLQISTNGGSSYSTVADFNYSIEFTNGVRKNTTVTIPGPFTSNTRFRFRADASADDDVVYIDDVVISGCQNSFTGGGGENVISDESNKLKESASDIVEIKTGPNPVSDFYMVQFQAKADAAQLDYLIMDMTGRVVLQNVYTCNEGYNLLNIDVHDLEKGTYILSLRTDKSRFAQKLILEK